VTNNCTSSVNSAPVVNIKSPASNSQYKAPAEITIISEASDVDGSITRVEFYNGSNRIGEKTSPPYSFNWRNVGKGEYTITAVAYDNQGLKTTSPAVKLSVKNGKRKPVISFAAPENEVLYTAPATIDLTLDAYDPDTAITKVEYYKGTTKIGESKSAPYSITLEISEEGTYNITAVASDDSDVLTTTPVLVIYVAFTYDDSGEMIRVYPNPTEGNLSVELLPAIKDGNYRLSVVNLAGKEVFQTVLGEGEKLKHIDISHLLSGIYFLIIANDEIIVTGKIIKK
jgi:hypothetical protein